MLTKQEYIKVMAKSRFDGKSWLAISKQFEKDRGHKISRQKIKKLVYYSIEE